MTNIGYYNRNDLATALAAANRFARLNRRDKSVVALETSRVTVQHDSGHWYYTAELADEHPASSPPRSPQKVFFNGGQAARTLKNVDSAGVWFRDDGSFRASGLRTAPTAVSAPPLAAGPKPLRLGSRREIVQAGSITPQAWAKMWRSASIAVKANSGGLLEETFVILVPDNTVIGACPYLFTSEPAESAVTQPVVIPARLVLAVGAMRRAGWEGWAVVRSGNLVQLRSVHGGVTESIIYEDRDLSVLARVSKLRVEPYQRIGAVNSGALSSRLATGQFALGRPAGARVWHATKGSWHLTVVSDDTVGDGGRFAVPFQRKPAARGAYALVANDLAFAAARFAGPGNIKIGVRPRDRTPKVRFVGGGGRVAIVAQAHRAGQG